VIGPGRQGGVARRIGDRTDAGFAYKMERAGGRLFSGARENSLADGFRAANRLRQGTSRP
jgi:hypothetical protein